MNDNDTPEIFEAATEAIFERTDGHGEDNFATIASFWSEYLGIDIQQREVADMMVLLKLARSKDGEYRGDNYTDMCGYAYHGDRLSKEEQEEESDGEPHITIDNERVEIEEITVGPLDKSEVVTYNNISTDTDDSTEESEECWTQYWARCSDELPPGHKEHVFIQEPREEAEQFALGLFTDISNHEVYDEYETIQEATFHDRCIENDDMSVEEFRKLPSVIVINSDEVDRTLEEQ